MPEDPHLAEIANQLAETRLSAELFDPDWRLLWVSEELKVLIGEHDEERLGYGKHIFESRLSEAWSTSITEEGRFRFFESNIHYILHDSTVDEDFLRQMGGEEAVSAFGDIEPEAPPPAWSYDFDYLRGDLPPTRVTCLVFRVHGEGGERLGTVQLYAPGLPATLLEMVARGDERMFERMARLVEPGRRQAAVLFADLQASGVLSRRLPSAAYFRLIRSLTTAIDEVVGRHGGMVGTHAGDGVTAFFLAENVGSPSGAARAAIDAAREIADVTGEVAASFEGEEVDLLDAVDLPMNIGLHWGDTLYMGQVVTGGRLEVTALGDEVNECARIQQSASDGEALASKALVEQLGSDDARSAGIDPDAVLYRTVAQLPGVDEKSVRDAGGIPVTLL
jgi:class 3 adenylate cyclase